LIRFNDTWSAERDGDGWVLYEIKRGTNRDTGAPTENTRRRFFPSLETACMRMLELTGDPAPGISELLAKLEETRAAVVAAINLDPLS
jgi:hypothetical protein